MSTRRPSSLYNYIIPIIDTSSSGAPSILKEPFRVTTLAISRGVGLLGREATWDDYSNSRFSDARFSVFGKIDSYKTSLYISPAEARAK